MAVHNNDESESGQTEREVPPRILYIMGGGRSGTTILEILLTNNPGVTGVGEVTHIFQDGFLDNVTCSCGALTSHCVLWSEVRQRCGWQDADIPDLQILFVNMAWHSRFPWVVAGLVPGSTKRRFRDINDCLFRSVAQVAVADVVVDSSKYAGRALALARAFPEQVRVICLTRSPAGLVRAFQRSDAEEQKPKSPFATLIYYLYTMTCFRVVAWILGKKVLRIRYEDLMLDPTGVLEKVENWGGVDLTQTKEKLNNNQWLEVGHIVTGNRIRRQDRIKFKPNRIHDIKMGILTRSVVLFMFLYRSLLGF